MQNWLFSEAAAQASAQIAAAVPDRRRAAEIERLLRTYPPVWALALDQDILSALLTAAQDEEPFWWRPARVALRAVSVRRRLAGLDAAEAWLLEDGLHPVRDVTDELDRAIAELLAKDLVIHTRQALAFLNASEEAVPFSSIASEPDGVLICLYDVNLRVAARRAVLSWLSEVARQRPSTAARVVLFNELAGDSLAVTQQILDRLNRPQAVAFIHAIAKAGGADTAAQLSNKLTEGLQRKDSRVPGEKMPVAVPPIDELIRCWERGMAAALGDRPRAISELAQAWDHGRSLAAAINLQLGRLYLGASDHHAALAAFRQGLALVPGDDHLRLVASQLLNELGRHDEALEIVGTTISSRESADLTIERARALTALRDTEQGMATTVKAAELAITPTQHREVAVLLSTWGKDDIAAIHLEQALAGAPDRAAWFAELGDIYAARSQWSAAGKCYQQWLAMEPANSTAMLRLCLALRTRGELSAALQVIEQAVQLSPQEPAVLVEWLTVAYQAEKWETAIQAGQLALTAETDSSIVHLMIGQACSALDDDDNALYHLRRATQLPWTGRDPSEPWLALAELVEKQGDAAQAELVLKEGLQALGDTSHPVLVRLGEFYENNGRPTEAHGAYWQAYQIGNRSSALLTRYGRLLGKLGHQEQAVTVLEEAAEQPDVAGGTYYCLSRALQQTGRGHEAVAAARQAAKLLSHNGEVLLHAGRLCLAHGDGGGAAFYLEEALSHLPNTAEIWELLGESQQLVGNWQETTEALWTALRLDPANPRLQYKIGVACFNLGEHETAITLLKEASDQLPQDIAVKESLGMVLENAGWWQEATRARQQAAELAPRDHERLLAWARTARQAGDLAAADEAIARAQQIAPKSLLLKLERALAQKASGDRPGSLRTLRDLIRESDDPSLLWQAGDAFIDMGKSEDGVVAFSRAADLRPDDPEAQVRLAKASAAAGNQQQALAAYEAAAELEPNNPSHHAAIGSVQWEMGKFARAADAWDKALTLDPSDLKVMERLAHAYARMGDPAAAIKIFEDVANRGDRESASVWQAWREAGRAALALGELDRARLLLTKALKSAPTDPESFSLVGALADQLGKSPEALDAYRKAAELAPAEHAYQLQLVDALTKSGCNLDAVNVWERLMEEADDIDQAAAMLVQMGKLYARAGRYEDAERVLRAALEQAPEDNELRAQLGSVLVERAERTDYDAEAGLSVPDVRTDLEPVLSWLESLDAPKARRDLARALLQVGRIREAINGLNGYLANIRTDLNAQRSLGVAYRRARSYEASIDVLSIAQRLAPSDERTAVELAKSYLAAGQPETAVTLLDRAARHAPQSPWVLYYLAQAHEASGERVAAIDSLAQAIRCMPEAGRWHRLLSRWLRAQGDARAALPHAEASVRYLPDTLSEVELAETLTDLGQIEGAIPHWQAAVKAEPENAQWWRELGSLLLRAGQPESASKSLEYAGRLAPDDSSIHQISAQALLAMGRIDEAGWHTQRAVALTPRQPAARAALGRWQAAKGAWQDALASFQTAVLWASDEESGISPLERAEYLLEVARAFNALGADDQALEQLGKAVELAPNLGTAFILMGDVYGEQGQQDLARQAYQHAAQIAPHNTHHLLRLAQFLQKEGQLDQALDWLMKAIAARPAASLWLEVARVYEQRGQRGRQLDSLLQAVELEPESSKAHFELGVVYKQRKEYQRAIEEFDRATRLDPNNTEAHKQLSAVLAISLASRIGGSAGQLVGMDR
jgi:tetratricopeptide (TPR) repeat protein